MCVAAAGGTAGGGGCVGHGSIQRHAEEAGRPGYHPFHPAGRDPHPVPVSARERGARGREGRGARRRQLGSCKGPATGQLLGKGGCRGDSNMVAVATEGRGSGGSVVVTVAAVQQCRHVGQGPQAWARKWGART